MGGKGGGSSGSVNFPAYMKEIHGNWMRDDSQWTEGTKLTVCVNDAMNAAMRDTLVTVTSSPYSSLTATDPDGAFFGSGETLSDYTGQSAFKLLELFLAETPESLYTTYADDAAATAAIASFSTDLATEYDSRMIPLYNVGYTDINATMSSAYTIGLTHIAAQQTREVAKFTGEVKTKVAIERVQMKMEWRRLLSTLSVENGRIYLAAKHEEDESNVDYEAKDNLWDLEIFQYGTQVMSSVSGAPTVSKGMPKPSALGGALAGAASGAIVGSVVPGIGTAVGAVVGGVLGLASTL